MRQRRRYIEYLYLLDSRGKVLPSHDHERPARKNIAIEVPSDMLSLLLLVTVNG
jgi:hypothetical protein